MCVGGGSIQLHRYQDVLWSLPVAIAGRDLTFVFDLGAGVTIVDAAHAALVPGPRRRASARRMTGERAEFDLAQPVVLTVGGARLAAESPAVMDLAALLPENWPRLDGALALDVLQATPFRVDFAAGTLTIGDAGDVRWLRRVPVRLFRQIPGVSLVVLVRIETAGRPLWFELDNCNVGPAIVSPESAVALGLDAGACTAVLRVGDLEPFPTPVRIAECLYDGNLGRTFTDGRTLAFNLANETLWVGAPRVPG